MKKILLAFAGMLGMVALQAQGTKAIVYDANAEVRVANGFSAIEVEGAIDLYLSQGTEEGVAISAADAEVKGQIKTEVTNGTLHIFFEKGLHWKNWTNTKAKAYVSFKELRRLEASGACNVTTTEQIRVGDFKMEFSGASDFNGKLIATNLTITASGASNIRIGGKTDRMTVETSGACIIRAYELEANYCNAEASGASSIRVDFNKELIADASGGSTIIYKGIGTVRESVTSGGASIKRSPY